jgi:DNA-binding MarR family transcriptional regulator
MQDINRIRWAHLIRNLHQWERENLPTYGTQAGYELFLQLAALPSGAQKPLKDIYLSMHCAESTTRLLLRKLESEGWIILPRFQTDERYKGFRLTDKFLTRIDEWVRVHTATLHALLADSDPPASRAP